MTLIWLQFGLRQKASPENSFAYKRENEGNQIQQY